VSAHFAGSHAALTGDLTVTGTIVTTEPSSWINPQVGFIVTSEVSRKYG